LYVGDYRNAGAGGGDVGWEVTVDELVEALEALNQPHATVRLKFDDFEGNQHEEGVRAVYSEHPKVVVVRAEEVV
jgi:hypothetical protein